MRGSNADWVAWVGFAIVAVFASGFARSSTEALLILGAGILLLLIGAWRRWPLRVRRSWDLQALRELQEEEEMREILADETVPDNDVAVCPNCATPFNESRLRCPICGFTLK